VYSFDDYTLAERKIVSIAATGQKPVMRVCLEDGREILATSDHMMVKVLDPKVKMQWAMRWFTWQPLSEFNPGDTVIASKASPETIVQQPLVDEELARFMGYRDASLAEYAINPFYDETYTQLLAIRSITPAGEAPVYEIEVENNESFVANGFMLL